MGSIRFFGLLVQNVDLAAFSVSPHYSAQSNVITNIVDSIERFEETIASRRRRVGVLICEFRKETYGTVLLRVCCQLFRNH